MKKIFTLFVILLFSNYYFSQLVKYEIKLKDITTQEAAKKIADPIRETFNNFKEPYKFQVKFDSQLGMFVILSNIIVDETELNLVLNKHNQTLLYFNASKL